MIRPYTPADKATLLDLIQLHIPQSFAPAEAADFAEYLDREIQDYFVAQDGAAICGCAGINYSEDGQTAILSWDMIHPNYQGQGWGRRLTEHRLGHIRQHSQAQSIVVRTSQLAYRFYQKFGFQLLKVEKDYWAKGFDLYYLKIADL